MQNATLVEKDDELAFHPKDTVALVHTGKYLWRTRNILCGLHSVALSEFHTRNLPRVGQRVFCCAIQNYIPVLNCSYTVSFKLTLCEPYA